jgi:hypothetical protein
MRERLSKAYAVITHFTAMQNWSPQEHAAAIENEVPSGGRTCWISL